MHKKAKTIYVTILIGCHTKCFNGCIVCAPCRTTLAPSQFIMHVLCFLSLSCPGFFLAIDFFDSVGRSVKELLPGFVILLHKRDTHTHTPSTRALITVNNFEPRRHMQRAISHSVCVWISLKSTLLAQLLWLAGWLFSNDSSSFTRDSYTTLIHGWHHTDLCSVYMWIR